MAEKPPVAEEFFYLDEAGEKQDANLHHAILNPVDYPIDETIMGPIRARHRAEHVNQQQAKSRAARWVRIKAKAQRLLETRQNGLYRVWNEQDHQQRLAGGEPVSRGPEGSGQPASGRAGAGRERDGEQPRTYSRESPGGPQRGRDVARAWNEADHPREPAGSSEGGRFASDGGGPEGSGQPASGAAGAGREPNSGQPRTYSRESPTGAQRERDVVAIWRSESATFYEHGGEQGAKGFHSAISRAKTGKFGASVHVYEPDDYKGMRLFTAPDGLSGFALKGDDIVSVFKHPDLKKRGVAAAALALAVENGGRRLDAFDTELPTLYSKFGFRAVARIKWSEADKPDGWDKDTYRDYNNGEPDVVFMVHSPGNTKLYTKGEGRTVKTYDEGTAIQQKTAPSVAGYTPGTRGRGRVEVETHRDEWVAASSIKTIDDIIAAAPIAQRSFSESARKVANELGVEFKDPGAKTVSAKGIDRTEEKIKDRKGVSARVTDTARGAFILTNPDQADAIIQKLGRTHEILAEPWRTIEQTSYTDRALLFRDRQTGLIGEIQLTEPKMVAAKLVGHKLYEESRSLPARIGTPPDDVPNPRVLELEAKQRAIYEPVLDSYKGTAWEIVDGRSRR